jgi:hypothetical protein
MQRKELRKHQHGIAKPSKDQTIASNSGRFTLDQLSFQLVSTNTKDYRSTNLRIK